MIFKMYMNVYIYIYIEKLKAITSSGSISWKDSSPVTYSFFLRVFFFFSETCSGGGKMVRFVLRLIKKWILILVNNMCNFCTLLLCNILWIRARKIDHWNFILFRWRWCKFFWWSSHSTFFKYYFIFRRISTIVSFFQMILC